MLLLLLLLFSLSLYCGEQLPVCHAKHSAAWTPCCKDSGIAQLQHMQCDSEITASRAYERMHLHTGHTSGCTRVSSITMYSWEQCLSAMQSLLLPHMLAANIQAQHSSAHAETTACRAYDRQHAHRPHIRVSPASPCTAESNACLLCKAFCCLNTFLQGFRHSTASAHAVWLRNHSKQSIWKDAFTHRPHIMVSPASQRTAASNVCLPCRVFCCLITLLQGFRQYKRRLSTASMHANCSAHGIIEVATCTFQMLLS